METGLWPQENNTEFIFGFRKVIYEKEYKGKSFNTK